MTRQYYPNTQMTGAAIVNISRSDNKFDSFTVRDYWNTRQIFRSLEVMPGMVVTHARQAQQGRGNSAGTFHTAAQKRGWPVLRWLTAAPTPAVGANGVRAAAICLTTDSAHTAEPACRCL